MSKKKSLQAVIVDGLRTPFLKAGTGFADQQAYQLAASSIENILKKHSIDKSEVDHVIMSTTIHNLYTSNIARESTLAAGLPMTTPSYTVSAAGASAAVAISQAIQMVSLGKAECIIAGGTDCASDVPIGYRKKMQQKLFKARKLKTISDHVRFLLSLNPLDFLPEIPEVRERSTGLTMGQFTESLATQLGISRSEQDKFAVASHQLAAKAQKKGYLKKEIGSVKVSESETIGKDNGIREKVKLSELTNLKPAFSKNGTLTAGNSSFLTDGASVVLIMSEAKAKSLSLQPKARLVDEVFTAHDPSTDLLTGPVFATEKLLKQTKTSTRDIGVFEYHEAFAAQILSVLKCLDSNEFAKKRLNRSQKIGEIDRDKLNQWGGSLAIGNPFAPNFARLLTTACNRLHVENQERALVGTCAGGGFGYAMMLEPYLN